jgi:hypothetical protein
MPTFAPPALPTFPSVSPFPAPSVAPGVSEIVPFIRPGLPTVAPPPLIVRPPIPTLPPLVTAPPALPVLGGAARTGAVGFAVVGAGVLGLGIGNKVYEDFLHRPFGPSLGDLYFPQGQPLPLPQVDQEPAVAIRGQCIAEYYIEGMTDRFLNGSFIGERVRSSGDSFLGPITEVILSPVYSDKLRAFYDGGRQFVDFPSGINRDDIQGRNLRNVTYRRIDNLPDECDFTQPFVPEPPKALPLTQPETERNTRPLLDPLRLPSPLRPPKVPATPLRPPEPGKLGTPFQPDIPGFPDIDLPGPLRDPDKVPFPTPDPLPDPIPNVPKAPPKAPPYTPLYECCASIERKLDELKDKDDCPELDLSEVEQLLEDIKAKLCVETQGSLDLTPCDAEEPVLSVYSGEGIEGIHQGLLAIAQSLDVIHDDTKCESECVSAVPDWWQVRKGADSPQLSVILRKEGTRNYHALNIPHPIVEPRPKTCAITPYVAGNWQATIYLIDNSKFICNAKLKGDAIRVANQAASMIDPVYLPNPLQIATTERRGFDINQSQMTPRYMDYQPDGQKGRRAVWRVLLD